MDFASEEEKESETPGDNEYEKTVAESSADSSEFFNEIYEKNIGRKVSLNASWILYVNFYWSHLYIIN